jgi:hypothetical protein
MVAAIHVLIIIGIMMMKKMTEDMVLHLLIMMTMKIMKMKKMMMVMMIEEVIADETRKAQAGSAIPKDMLAPAQCLMVDIAEIMAVDALELLLKVAADHAITIILLHQEDVVHLAQVKAVAGSAIPKVTLALVDIVMIIIKNLGRGL